MGEPDPKTPRNIQWCFYQPGAVHF